jgi:hypothetical protein
LETGLRPGLALSRPDWPTPQGLHSPAPGRASAPCGSDRPTAAAGGSGGGIFNLDGPLTVSNCAFSGNSVGGGIDNGRMLTIRAGDATGARCPWPKGISSNPRGRRRATFFLPELE